MKRAAALARKTREMGKNLSKRKGMRRMVDRLLTDPTIMATIPAGGAIAAGYAVAKRVSKVGVSPCLKKWFDCLTDPFSQNAQGACIPSGANIDSSRYFGYVRGDIVIGTNGYGCMVLCPTPYNDLCCGFASTSAYNGNSTTILTANNVVAVNQFTSLSMPNNRFSSGQVFPNQQQNEAVQARLVGGGLRLYYTGSELSKGGLVSIYTSPVHHNVSAQVSGAPNTASSLGALQETAIYPVSREPYEYPLTPVLQNELVYPELYPNGVNVATAATLYCYPWSNGSEIFNNGFTTTSTVGNTSVVMGSPSTVVLISGTAGQTVHFEFALHSEAVGDLTEGQRLPADSDPMGVDALMAGLSRMQIERNSKPHLSAAAVLKAQYTKVVSARDTKIEL